MPSSAVVLLICAVVFCTAHRELSLKYDQYCKACFLWFFPMMKLGVSVGVALWLCSRGGLLLKLAKRSSCVYSKHAAIWHHSTTWARFFRGTQQDTRLENWNKLAMLYNHVVHSMCTQNEQNGNTYIKNVWISFSLPHDFFFCHNVGANWKVHF